MEVWMIVSASPHTLSPFTPIQGQHHTMSHIPTITMSHIPTITMSNIPTITMSHIPTITMSHIPTITMSHIPTIKMSHIPTITIFPYYYNCHVQYSWFWKKNWTLQIIQTDFTPCANKLYFKEAALPLQF